MHALLETQHRIMTDATPLAIISSGDLSDHRRCPRRAAL